MIHLGAVPAGTTIYVPFTTYAGATGASVTCSGLAVTDIEIYKNGSVTQRASDNGYTLLDTDGIDFDGITGLHGFSIDLNDNTDSGFYAVGSWYWVVVSAITVDSQTVTFLAAVFRIAPAEAVTGKPKVDVDAFGGTAGTFSSGRPEVNATHWGGTSVSSANVLIDGAITADKIASDAITDAKVASDVTIANVTGNVGGIAGTTNTFDALQIALNSAHGSGSWTTATGFSTLDAAGVRSALGLASANLDSQLGDIPTNLELAVALATSDDATLAAIAGLNNLSAAEVNAEVLDVLNVDTFAEESSVPPSTTSLRKKIGWIFMWMRNRSNQTSTQRKLYADDATTVVSTETVSDDGTTYEKGEAS